MRWTAHTRGGIQHRRVHRLSARYRHTVAFYIQFPLAREMELMAEDTRRHTGTSNKPPRTFSLRVLTKYLQPARNTRRVTSATPLQEHAISRPKHASKQDELGRRPENLNGCLRTRIPDLDISSGGTGATILSPEPSSEGPSRRAMGAAVMIRESLSRRDLGSAVMSEIFYRRYPHRTCLTSRLSRRTAIGGRTAPNNQARTLFRYLKQGRHTELKESVDYFIERQIENGFAFPAPASTHPKHWITSRALTERCRRARRKTSQMAGGGMRQHAGERAILDTGH